MNKIRPAIDGFVFSTSRIRPAPRVEGPPPQAPDPAPPGPGPCPLTLRPPPPGYAEIFSDVGRSAGLSILRDPAVHFALYGQVQGRRILSRLPEAPDKVVLISPSHLKQCGIGEYGRYLADQFTALGMEVRVVRKSDAALDLDAGFLDGALVIVNHGPGLFDGLNPRLSQGDSTTHLLQNLNHLAEGYGAIPLVVHHSLLDTDQQLLFSRQQQILNSDIPSVTFIGSAGRHFLLPSVELGVSPVHAPADSYGGQREERAEVIGFFGFYQYGGKDFGSLFHLARQLRARLVGSVATGSAEELQRFETELEDSGIAHEFGSGWVEDTELLERLSAADYFYLPQNDHDHWNNSATARFVTNLDRPLFLPPHQPFLDMADGAIFATTEDLPRIVARFREQAHYDAAVARIRAFRDRARMDRTAQTLRCGLVERVGATTAAQLEGPNEVSAERVLELTVQAQADFAATLGSDPAGGIAALLPDLGACYRAVPPVQFWRKHYELGDFLFDTLLETVHAIFINICKRPANHADLIALTGDHDDDPIPAGQIVRHTFLRALEEKATLFHDPQIVFLRGGEICDWRQEIAPDRQDRFLQHKRRAQRAVAGVVEARATTGPAITNVLELLILPAEALLRRPAPIDLTRLNFAAIHGPRTPGGRFNVLVAECNAAGIDLGAHLVFDVPQPAPIDPMTTDYMAEDFLLHHGDQFLLNAIRCIDKRDPFPVEMLVLGAMMQSLDRIQVLRHLRDRAQGRIGIRGFSGRSDNALLHDCQGFIQTMRDPLSGLIEARNAFEIRRRDNERWWLGNKELTDRLWQDAGCDNTALNELYARLVEPVQHGTQGGRAGPVLPGAGVSRAAPDGAGGLPVLTDSAPAILSALAAPGQMPNLAGFHAPEATHAWVDGTAGTMAMSCRFDPPPRLGRPALRLTLGFHGSAALGPRDCTVSVQYLNDPDQEWISAAATLTVQRDDTARVEVPCPGLRTGAQILVAVTISAAISPAEIGGSDDARTLGVMVSMIELRQDLHALPASPGAG